MLPLIEHYSEISDTITSSGSNSTKRRRIGGLASDNSVTITTTINQSNDIFDLNPNKIFLIWKPDYEYILINDFLSYTSIYNFTSTDASKIEWNEKKKKIILWSIAQCLNIVLFIIRITGDATIIDDL